MTGTPFFVTAATAAATPQDAPATTKATGVKRRAPSEDAAAKRGGVELLRSQLAQLEATKKNQFIPLGDIRDVVMDHVLEMTETDLRHTVVLVCEDVPDFRAATDDNSSSDALPSFLEGVDGSFRLYSKVGEGDSIPRSDSILLRMPISKREIENEKKAAKKAVKKQIKKFKKAHGDTSALTADFYVLSDENLRRHLGSIPFDEDYAAQGYISTVPLPDGETREAEKLLLALDCEMCKTTKGVELTRVTLVDAKENVLLDEYVRPKNPIVDYCTQYSGITQDIMESCTNRLADIQQRFLALVPAEAILVGHSIENDLQALRVIHRRVIDTTVLYPHPRGPPFRSALRFLTSTFLHRAIQTGTDGHCSVEDAVATLQLVQLKVKRGPAFPSVEQEYSQKKIINELSLAKKSVLIVDSQRGCRALAAGAACTLPSESPAQVVQHVVHQLTTGFPPHFTWARVQGASRAEIGAHVAHIRAHLPSSPPSLLLVVALGATQALRDAHKTRTTRSDPRSSLLWDKAQQLQLDVLASRTQEGIVHVLLP